MSADESTTLSTHIHRQPLFPLCVSLDLALLFPIVYSKPSLPLSTLINSFYSLPTVLNASRPVLVPKDARAR